LLRLRICTHLAKAEVLMRICQSKKTADYNPRSFSRAIVSRIIR
jgi:hypothetical protein